tara:strand:- start:856 stop:1074 length:219 start_codon:yes stop_codon:yes gene_type:complete
MTTAELAIAIKAALNPPLPANPTTEQLASLGDTIASNLAQAISDYVDAATGNSSSSSSSTSSVSSSAERVTF